MNCSSQCFSQTHANISFIWHQTEGAKLPLGHAMTRPMCVEHAFCILAISPFLWQCLSGKAQGKRVFALTLTFSFGIQFSSVAQSCLTLCDPMNRSTPGLLVHHQLLESTQTQVSRMVMLSSHLILCHPLLLLPSIFSSTRVFSNESVLHIMWPNYWSFSKAEKDVCSYIYLFMSCENLLKLCLDDIRFQYSLS